MSVRNDYTVPTKHGEPPTVRYGIALADMLNLKSLTVSQGEPGEVATAVYDGAGAITLANYNGLPVGSLIVDLQIKKLHIHDAAATWKSSAAFT